MKRLIIFSFFSFLIFFTSCSENNVDMVDRKYKVQYIGSEQKLIETFKSNKIDINSTNDYKNINQTYDIYVIDSNLIDFISKDQVIELLHINKRVFFINMKNTSMLMEIFFNSKSFDEFSTDI